MAGRDVLDRNRIDRIKLESRVRLLVRQQLYRDYPRQATPRLVDQAVRRVMQMLDEAGR